MDTEFYCAELCLDQLGQAQGPDPEYVPLPKFPAVERDIAVVCDKAVTVGALEDCIRKGAKGLLKNVALFDIYTGAGIPEGKKSVAFSLTLRADDRSLTSEEADADVKSILETLEKDLGAVLRCGCRRRFGAPHRGARVSAYSVPALPGPGARRNSLPPRKCRWDPASAPRLRDRRMRM